MLDHTRIFQNVLNEIFFEMFVRSNQGIKEFCSMRNFDVDEIKGILFRRETPNIMRLSELVNQDRLT